MKKLFEDSAMKICTRTRLVFLMCLFVAGGAFAANPTKYVSLGVNSNFVAGTHDYGRATPDAHGNFYINNAYQLGYLPYFRVFIPPGAYATVGIELLEWQGQTTIAHHKTPPTHEFGQLPVSTSVKLADYEKADLSRKGLTVEQSQGRMTVLADQFLPPYLPVSRAGWFYVKVDSLQGSNDAYYNTTQISVNAAAYNEWYDHGGSNPDGSINWERDVEGVTEYKPITSAPTPILSPILSVTSSTTNLANTSGTATFTVANTGGGTMAWTATVTSGGDWFTIPSGTKGSNGGSFTGTYSANKNSTTRTAKISITATGATGSPATITFTQAAGVASTVNPTKYVTLQCVPNAFYTCPSLDYGRVGGSGRQTILNLTAGERLQYFRVFVPPGTWRVALDILDWNTQNAIAHHKTLPKKDFGGFPDSSITTKGRSLAELESGDQIIAKAEGRIQILGDLFSPSPLSQERGGWLYVKVGSGGTADYSNKIYISVDAETYNEWYDHGGSNPDGSINWERDVEGVTEYKPITSVPAPAPALSVTTPTTSLTNTAGTAVFTVANTGGGTMAWTATTTSSGNWFTIPSGTSGSNGGSFTGTYSANTTASIRTATVKITAAGATGSPATINITQVGSGTPILSVAPTSQNINNTEGTAIFNVSNKGKGTLTWTAAVTSGKDWLKITSGSSGTNSGTITSSYSANSIASKRTGTIQVFSSRIVSSALGTDVVENSAVDVTVTQEAGATSNILKVTPADHPVTKDKGTASFEISNDGTGSMPWSASITEGSSWLSYASASSGNINAGGKGSLIFNYTENTGAIRKAKIRITPNNAGGTPVNVTVTQAAKPVSAILSVYPLIRYVTNSAGSTTFGPSNSGAGTMKWTSTVISGGDWLRIKPGNESGVNSGATTCRFAENKTGKDRKGTVRIVGIGADNSPIDVTVNQSATEEISQPIDSDKADETDPESQKNPLKPTPIPATECSAILDERSTLYVPYISPVNATSDAVSFWASFAYVIDEKMPTSTYFRLMNVEAITKPITSCAPAILTGDLKIQIPDAILPNGIHTNLNLEYDPTHSTEKDSVFVVVR